MHTMIIVSDFTNNRRTIVLLNDDHFDKMESVWTREESILVEMQHNSFFTGRRRWCDLNPTHFRLMIARNLTMVAGLSDELYNDSLNHVVKSLQLLMAGMVLCLQKRNECLVDMMKIARLSESEVTYEFSASLNMAIDSQKPKDGLRIIVDNEN